MLPLLLDQQALPTEELAPALHADPQILLERLFECSKGPAALAVLLARVRNVLEPHLNWQGLLWEDVVPLATSEAQLATAATEVATASSPEGKRGMTGSSSAGKLLSPSSSASAGIFSSLFAVKAASKLKGAISSLAGKAKVTEVAKVWYDSQPMLRKILADPNFFLKKLKHGSTASNAGGSEDVPSANDSDADRMLEKELDRVQQEVHHKLTITNIRPQLERVTAAQQIKWLDVVDVLKAVNPDQLALAAVEPEQFLSQTLASPGPACRALYKARLRPATAAYLAKAGYEWLDLAAKLEECSDEVLKAGLANPLMLVNEQLGPPRRTVTRARSPSLTRSNSMSSSSSWGTPRSRAASLNKRRASLPATSLPSAAPLPAPGGAAAGELDVADTSAVTLAVDEGTLELVPPSPPPSPGGPPDLSITISDSPIGIGISNAGTLILVTSVDPDSPAEVQGLRKGAVVRMVGGEPTDGMNKAAILELVEQKGYPLTLAFDLPTEALTSDHRQVMVAQRKAQKEADAAAAVEAKAAVAAAQKEAATRTKAQKQAQKEALATAAAEAKAASAAAQREAVAQAKAEAAAVKKAKEEVKASARSEAKVEAEAEAEAKAEAKAAKAARKRRKQSGDGDGGGDSEDDEQWDVEDWLPDATSTIHNIVLESGLDVKLQDAVNACTEISDVLGIEPFDLLLAYASFPFRQCGGINVTIFMAFGSLLLDLLKEFVFWVCTFYINMLSVSFDLIVAFNSLALLGKLLEGFQIPMMELPQTNLGLAIFSNFDMLFFNLPIFGWAWPVSTRSGLLHPTLHCFNNPLPAT